MRFLSYLIALFIILLPLIHGSFLKNLGFDISSGVSGNYEFTKSVFFIIFVSLLFFAFIIGIITRRLPSIHITKSETLILTGFILILAISSVFSLSPLMSIYGDTEKGHTALFFIAGSLMYLLFRQFGYKEHRRIDTAITLSYILVIFFAVKEYYFPTLGYGALSNRALGTFGHPNYLGAYILACLPFVLNGRNIFLALLLGGAGILTLILAKSLIALVLALAYIIYLLSRRLSRKTKGYFGLTALFLVLVGGVLIFLYYPEKLHSLISRWYIWKSVIHMISDHPWRWLVGFGAETLPYYFESYKVPELYIFENFGFTADRSHNAVLDIFYHFGALGLTVFCYALYCIKDAYKSAPKYLLETLILLACFSFFHYLSSASLLLLILTLARIAQSQKSLPSLKMHPYTLIVGVGVSSFCVLLFTKLYLAEIAYSNYDISRAREIIAHPKYERILENYQQSKNLESLLSPLNLKAQIRSSSQKIETCKTLTHLYPSAENFIFCGNIFKESGNSQLARQYYQQGLERLPDLWNEDSKYWKQYFVRETITGNRFFSKKFGNIREVLEYGENK